jgi:FHS family L-fucose permease-like MFS transporter
MMSNQPARTTLAFIYVTSLFFAWGFVTATIDPLVPLVKSVFTLTYSESLLTQFAFFLSYAIVSLPASALVARRGSAASIVIALITMVVGCLIIPIATALRAYPLVLLALFVIGSGITLLQVAANPLAAALGSPERSHMRLVLSQAFNSLGTTVAPFLGAKLLLSGGVFGGGVQDEAALAESLHKIDLASFVLAGAIALLAFGLWRVREHLATRGLEADAKPHSPFEALKSRWAVAGAAGIFLYVGAEVSIGSLVISFLVQPDILGISHEEAGGLLARYWGGAMIGRFIGSILLSRFRAGPLLTGVALVAAALCAVVSQSGGDVAATALLSIGLFNSIMFPTIFTLTLERSSASPASTSGLLCMAIVGGALLPQLVGHVADATSLGRAFLVPAAAYLCIAFFAAATSRKAPVVLAGARQSLH